jgi:hypothetical protein
MNKDRLRDEVRFEIAQLRRVAEVARELADVPVAERRPWDAAAAAKYVFDLAMSLENLCKRRNAAFGRPHPSGPDSHSQLLEEFLQDPNLGGQLGADEALLLKQYFRFRHRFAHGYGHEVHWEIVAEPLRLLPQTIERLAMLWEQWLELV